MRKTIQIACFLVVSCWFVVLAADSGFFSGTGLRESIINVGENTAIEISSQAWTAIPTTPLDDRSGIFVCASTQTQGTFNLVLTSTNGAPMILRRASSLRLRPTDTANVCLNIPASSEAYLWGTLDFGLVSTDTHTLYYQEYRTRQR